MNGLPVPSMAGMWVRLIEQGLISMARETPVLAAERMKDPEIAAGQARRLAAAARHGLAGARISVRTTTTNHLDGRQRQEMLRACEEVMSWAQRNRIESGGICWRDWTKSSGRR